jgi:hypothetical protein
MIKRLEGIQKGQEVYLVPSDSRCTPQYAEVYSVGPKYIKLIAGVNIISISLREFFSEDGRSAKWGGWELFLSKESYEEHKELLSLRSQVVTLFEQMILKCEDLDKLRRLKKRYAQYDDPLPF